MTYERTFQEEVLDRLARIEVHLEVVPSTELRVGKLEAQRNYVAGAMGLVTLLASYFHLVVKG